MSIKLIPTFKVLSLTFYVVAVLKLNQLHFFTTLSSFLKYSFNSITEGLGSIANLSEKILAKILILAKFGDQNYTQVKN